MEIFENIFKKIARSEPRPEDKNPLKSEHLKEGVKPIMACIGTPEQCKADPGAEKEFFQYLSPDNDSPDNRNSNINYYEDPVNLSNKNFKNAGSHSYVISQIDNTNKFSESFKNCTGLIVTGIDKDTGENISFMSHEDPTFFLRKENIRRFGDDLREMLEELKLKSAEGTIDAVIVGGNYFNDGRHYNEEEWQDNYLKSIKLLAKEVRGALGFEPVVITGPKTVSGRDDVFYDNGHRRLYIIRPEVGNESTKSYLPSDAQEQRKKW